MAGLFKKYYPALLFILSLTVVSLLYDYQHLLFKRPQSVHKWRQADGASIALNYYQDGMNFFRPETHNLTSDHGTSGKCYPSELPILYYAVACLYKIFGYHEWIFRGLNTAIFFLGLFYLFRLFRYLWQDVFWAICLPLLLLASPVIAYYANNYIVNTAALAITFIGWYYFVRFLSEKKNKLLYLAVFAFFIAATLKITALFSLFAICGIFMLELSGLKKFGETKLFPKALPLVIPAGLAALLNAAWIAFVNYYNAKHDCAYFSTNIFPLWSLKNDEIRGVLHNVKNIWMSQYFHLSAYIFLSLLFLFVVLRFKRMNAIWSYLLMFLLLEILAYCMLEFRQFADHDYYVIDIFIFPVLLILCFFDWFKKEKEPFFISFYVKWSFAVFLGCNLLNAKEKLKDRYEGWMNDYAVTKDFYTITPYLRQIGITPADTVIAIPDGSHVSLYLMNQKGWTEYTDMRLHKEAPIPYNADSAGIRSSIRKGAKYLIVNGVEELYKKPYLKPFATNLAGRYNNILIFNLKDKTQNFNLDQRKIRLHYFCDAEAISADKEYFVKDSVRFEFARTRSGSFAHSGKFSCRLDKQNPYGMTVRINTVKEGQSFLISVWRKTGSAPNSTIIVQAPSYYNNLCEVKGTANGWEELVKEFSVTPGLNGKELTIYLYNEDTQAAYFDDLDIVQYEAGFR